MADRKSLRQIDGEKEGENQGVIQIYGEIEIWRVRERERDRESEKEKKVRETAEGTNLKKDFDLIEQVDEYLLQILAEVLKVEESVLQQAHVREEVDYVFSTWRRPHLLVDYYRMHSSTPEIQNNFRR